MQVPSRPRAVPGLFALLIWSAAGCTSGSGQNVRTGDAPAAATVPAQAQAQAQVPAPLPHGPFPEGARPLHESFADQYMVVTQGEASTRAARKMFELGGNVVDAAAAASFALAVERPQSTGIGGGGFMLVHLAGSTEVTAIDFREKAPDKAHRDMFLDAQGNVLPRGPSEGARASGVPGMVAGVLTAHEKFGKLPRATVMAPAIELAEGGFPVYPHLAAAIKQRRDLLKLSPEALSIFFTGGDVERPLTAGERIVQKNLARTLREISTRGRDGFYKGWVAEAIVAEEARVGGLIAQRDLDAYEVKLRPPLRGDYGPYTIVSMPPPSSGGVHVLQMLNILKGYPQGTLAPYDPAVVHRTASAMQIAYYDRATYLGDSDFVRVPVRGLTSQRYADDWRRRIPEGAALHLTTDKVLDPQGYESTETTHFTVADRAGNVVASTQTVNGWLGSGVVVAGGGFVLNNEMDDFSAKPGVPNKFGVTGGEDNAIAPGKRPLSSMSPTIVLKGDRPVLALGTPSGSQIITCVTLSVMNYLGYRMPLWDAVTALRYHHQWTPDRLLVEAPGFPEPTAQALRALGHNIKVGGIGCKIQAIAYEEGRLHGVSDPRGEGLAAGEKPIPVPPPPAPGAPKSVVQD